MARRTTTNQKSMTNGQLFFSSTPTANDRAFKPKKEDWEEEEDGRGEEDDEDLGFLDRLSYSEEDVENMSEAQLEDMKKHIKEVSEALTKETKEIFDEGYESSLKDQDYVDYLRLVQMAEEAEKAPLMYNEDPNISSDGKRPLLTAHKFYQETSKDLRTMLNENEYARASGPLFLQSVLNKVQETIEKEPQPGPRFSKEAVDFGPANGVTTLPNSTFPSAVKFGGDGREAFATGSNGQVYEMPVFQTFLEELLLADPSLAAVTLSKDTSSFRQSPAFADAVREAHLLTELYARLNERHDLVERAKMLAQLDSRTRKQLEKQGLSEIVANPDQLLYHALRLDFTQALEPLSVPVSPAVEKISESLKFGSDFHRSITVRGIQFLNRARLLDPNGPKPFQFSNVVDPSISNEDAPRRFHDFEDFSSTSSALGRSPSLLNTPELRDFASIYLQLVHFRNSKDSSSPSIDDVVNPSSPSSSSSSKNTVNALDFLNRVHEEYEALDPVIQRFVRPDSLLTPFEEAGLSLAKLQGLGADVLSSHDIRFKGPQSSPESVFQALNQSHLGQRFHAVLELPKEELFKGLKNLLSLDPSSLSPAESVTRSRVADELLSPRHNPYVFSQPLTPHSEQASVFPSDFSRDLQDRNESQISSSSSSPSEDSVSASRLVSRPMTDLVDDLRLDRLSALKKDSFALNPETTNKNILRMIDDLEEEIASSGSLDNLTPAPLFLRDLRRTRFLSALSTVYPILEEEITESEGRLHALLEPKEETLNLNPRKKAIRCYCPFCKDAELSSNIHYLNVHLLLSFMNELGAIMPRRVTKLCGKHQRLIARTVKRAKHFGVFSNKQGFFTITSPFQNDFLGQQAQAARDLDDFVEDEFNQAEDDDIKSLYRSLMNYPLKDEDGPSDRF
eukprot:CAMPEP_0184369558 /NCGR_PEP_ID=MMETSP1089-20130417/162314_1 /TAXON_ID=38269 ORGANISM="Gloeochaete wittrockiana, Strain SAG46.84" /NCGR_SAMPLE_ID=MMETSP1089 /ASSEMBLY_ACC=CAM_ASM_000445 /LENGTH=903 /DNA_ID=CAMNT_0026712019 /DNA_START=56 /DNA_END=2768 /DNA_ORIENTATION=-